MIRMDKHSTCTPIVIVLKWSTTACQQFSKNQIRFIWNRKAIAPQTVHHWLNVPSESNTNRPEKISLRSHRFLPYFTHRLQHKAITPPKDRSTITAGTAAAVIIVFLFIWSSMTSFVDCLNLVSFFIALELRRVWPFSNLTYFITPEFFELLSVWFVTESSVSTIVVVLSPKLTVALEEMVSFTMDIPCSSTGKSTKSHED